MIAIAKNLGEQPLVYITRFQPLDNGKYLAIGSDGKKLTQQPTGGNPYVAAYGSLTWSDDDGEWQQCELHGQIVTFISNGERFGYCWF